MAQSAALTVVDYLAELSPERRQAIAAVRHTVLENLPDGYEEVMASGMIGYVIPLERYPKTYNKLPLVYAALASQKQYMSLYLMNVYGDQDTERWFNDAYKATGKKLDMGKSCVRFKTLNDLPLDVIGQAVARTPLETFIQRYEASRSKTRRT
jgi:hypothetical protein